MYGVYPVSFSASIRTIAEFQRRVALFRVDLSARKTGQLKMNKAMAQMFEQYPPTQK